MIRTKKPTKIPVSRVNTDCKLILYVWLCICFAGTFGVNLLTIVAKTTAITNQLSCTKSRINQEHFEFLYSLTLGEYFLIRYRIFLD